MFQAHFAAIPGAAIIGLAFRLWVLPVAGVDRRVDRWPSPRRDLLIGILTVAVPRAILFLVVAPEGVLPGHDPIIVPTLAQSLLGHWTTMEVYQHGDPGLTYPPGYPILFSLVSLVVSPIASLGIFKVWTALSSSS